nr:retrotransposon protein, putative, Ty1-copia subclass [Tanacetum cinerariifolium]
MQSMENTISEVRSLLIEFKKSIKRNKQPIVGASSTPQVMAIQGGRVHKYKPQGKAKKKRKGNGAKKLKRGTLYLYVGNGVRAKVEAIESFNLVLPNGLIIILDSYHYAPSITRGVVSVAHLFDKGFTQYFTDFRLSVSMNNMSYFNAVTVNGIYEINMHDSTLPIINSMYSISNKRTKSKLDYTYLWHCRLAHINKKRIEKLQHDRLLKSTDKEPFDQCVSCISGKMIRKSFSHKNEKVKDVLGLIHTDVCGPLRHVSKKGASYLITFTDDYSRYGYVYLLKHQHKVIETVKVSIYGLKQASKSRNKRFDEEIKKFSFHQNLDEPCVNQKASGSNVILLILYVDDIILMGNHIPSLQERYRMDNSKRGSTLIIMVKFTRLMVYGGDPKAEQRVNCYCDAQFETDRGDTKSQTRYVFIYIGGAVVWKSFKQSTTAQHVIEAASEAAKEAVWIRKFIDELGIVL